MTETPDTAPADDSAPMVEPEPTPVQPEQPTPEPEPVEQPERRDDEPDDKPQPDVVTVGTETRVEQQGTDAGAE